MLQLESKFWLKLFIFKYPIFGNMQFIIFPENPKIPIKRLNPATKWSQNVNYKTIPTPK